MTDSQYVAPKNVNIQNLIFQDMEAQSECENNYDPFSLRFYRYKCHELFSEQQGELGDNFCILAVEIY